MGAVTSKGIQIYLSKGASTPTDLKVTGIAAAKPAVLTCDETGVVAGDVVAVSGTGIPALDGKMFVVLSTGSGIVTLEGSDATVGAFTAGTAKADHFATTDMIRLCLSSISINADEPGVTEVGTYCNPSATLPSAATSAGTLSFAGFANKADADYVELLLAAEDAKLRYLRIDLPQSNGHIIAPVTVSSITWDLPLAGAIGYSGTAALGSKPRHTF